MNKKLFLQCLAEGDFGTLFIYGLLWNNPQTKPFDVRLDDATALTFRPIAQRNGLQVLACAVAEIPSGSMARKIDTRLRRHAHDYICIYHLPAPSQHHLWAVPVQKVEKRDLVLVEYETAAQAEFLYGKMDGLAFDMDDETTITDVKERVHGAFIVNAERVTGDFYKGFRRQHTRFAACVTGIDDDHARQWYTSVMLNRLMFCYFIQKKGFLDLNTDYLGDKLKWVREEQGHDRFYGSFYRGFLRALFHDGLNAPRHEASFLRTYGRIPYLNGGMFDQHEVERRYPGLDIEDSAFEELFAFFDQWHWHLDDRLTASGRDINPDVLGYIFEQYINDRAQMGAYYTKEDITEYIGRNTVLPFLMDATRRAAPDAFRPGAALWQFLQGSGDRYIYDAVKHGCDEPIPPHVAVGIDTAQPNLLERRSRWNERTPARWGLPTEIWRETVERLQRCRAVRDKIEGGEVTDINDFITLNLDIRRFVYDWLAQTDDHLFVRHFYAALRRVTVLDPTCGSGAFLFAALNILEPLYEVCIDRMQEWNRADSHPFADELRELNGKYRSNIRYFIYKSIILRNLYGVDIMNEATEIAKLRLFLKMVAVVDVNPRDPNLGLDPLPDIDFNIRCGNTLVGYATEQELEQGVRYMDIFARDEFEKKVYDELEVVSAAYDTFRMVQLEQDADLETFKQAKAELNARLSKLNQLLSQTLHKSTAPGKDYAEWERSHQPFHWIAEFYDIIHGNGGFDVIIGNPPYVEYAKIKTMYHLDTYKTIKSGNIYAQVLERSEKIIHNGTMGWIVPISVSCTDRTITIQNFINTNFNAHSASFDIFPSKLFEGAAQRVTILLLRRGNGLFTSKYHRWNVKERKLLFQLLSYCKNDYYSSAWTPRLHNSQSLSIISKMSQLKTINSYINQEDAVLYIHRVINNFIKAIDFEPYCRRSDGQLLKSDDFKVLNVPIKYKELIACALNSSLFYAYWRMHGDGFHCGFNNILRFPMPEVLFSEDAVKPLKQLCKRLILDFKKNSKIKTRNQTTTGEVKLQTFYIGKSKPIIDEIDVVLAKWYDFSEEELDFIINYDIKYRMGDELGNNK